MSYSLDVGLGGEGPRKRQNIWRRLWPMETGKSLKLLIIFIIYRRLDGDEIGALILCKK